MSNSTGTTVRSGSTTCVVILRKSAFAASLPTCVKSTRTVVNVGKVFCPNFIAPAVAKWEQEAKFVNSLAVTTERLPKRRFNWAKISRCGS